MLSLEEYNPINTVEKVDNLLELLDKHFSNNLNRKELNEIEVKILINIRKIKIQIYFKEQFFKKILVKYNTNILENPKSKSDDSLDYKSTNTDINPQALKFIIELDAFNSNPVLDHNVIKRYEKTQLEYFKVVRDKRLSAEDWGKIRSKFEIYTNIIRDYIKNDNREPTLKQRVEELKAQKNTIIDSSFLSKKAIDVLPTDTSEDPIHRK
ncbi:hypothetical protein [Runella salmonicolor]|uniref:Uncharacterized protein n=1 Tax=Runella salmonicolor TaxID=2950278 RepID=A0ABT1FQL7_9BACT|nr:hypothetical protein [Runella salmonicolor]MCP1384066.1 hypothetical protein [Runella salmonicolor]